MGLFDFLKKKNDSEIKPIEFYEILNREVKPLENIMVGFSSSLPSIKKVDDRIDVLKALIESYYDLRSKCISLGPDYQSYFSRMWEHCHNSRNKDFCFIEKYEEELENLSANRDLLFSEQSLHEEKSKNLEQEVVKILAKNPVILQTDIYKKFDPVVQKDIQSILYFMAKEGKIKRKKAGNSYLIYSNGGIQK